MEKKEPVHNAIFRIIKNGPIEARGNYHLSGPDGKRIQTDSVIYLCRCGNSGKKPFCDGSHRKSGLRD
jgi:CDGSH iron-sulfur domain-containing protein 3